MYGFVGSDDFELYHDLHGSDGCVVYCVSRGAVGVAVPRWCGDEGSDVYGGDVILPHTGVEESLQVLEHSVVGTIGVGLGRLRKLHGIRSLIRNVGTLFEGHWRKCRCVGSTLGWCRNCVVNRYLPYPSNLCRHKFASLIGRLGNTVLCLTWGLPPLICALRDYV